VTAMDFFARWRVRLGYLLTIFVLWLARPTPRSITVGAVVGFVGLCARAYAAGYLHKQEVLTTTGPYAHTRNPLYFGSSILMLGAGVAMHSWWAAALLFLYFAFVYTLVMRREEMELRRQHSVAFDAYAAAVPLFFPRMTTPPQIASAQTAYSWAQYKKNREYRAALGFLLLLVGLGLILYLRAR
jgi:protein-S-isoprenylcysteine O-methyltransferase Ste14